MKATTKINRLECMEQIKNYLSLGDLHQAKQLIEEYQEQLKDDIEFINLKGILFIYLEDIEQAQLCFKKAVESDPEYIDAYYNLGYCGELLGNLDDALQIYEALKKKDISIDLKKNAKESIERVLNNKFANIKKEENIFSRRSQMSYLYQEDDAPLVSIMVLAYNNLEKYTKTCIECILKYTQGIDYELILVDNGSTDGTYEYFQSIEYHKKQVIHIEQNKGAGHGSYYGNRACSGKYRVWMPNDMYVTKNWLNNMLACAMSDPRIGMVTHMSDYVSNLQAVDLQYTDFEDMQEKAAVFNQLNPNKWHERLRLITLATLISRECCDMIGVPDYGFLHDFGDDDISFRVRRMGYKAMLCKDTFICHAGRMTDKGVDVARDSLQKGRTDFREKYYQIDAWDDVNNYESEMISFINPDGRMNYNVLGVDVLCGTPLLEVKNKLIEQENGSLVNLSAFTTHAKYWLDLNTICNGKVICDRIQYVDEAFSQNQFDYIVMGKYLNQYQDCYNLLDKLLGLLKEGGKLLVKFENIYSIQQLRYMATGKYLLQQPSKVQFTLEEIVNYLQDKGCQMNNVHALVSELNDKDEQMFEAFQAMTYDYDQKLEWKERLKIGYYILQVEKKRGV